MIRHFAIVVLAAVILGACGDSDELVSATASDDESRSTSAEGSGGAPEVVEVEVAGRSHVVGDVEYPTSPPAGGDHFGAWQNCGFYTEPLIDEVAVHSLEHGAVWVTFLPDTDRSTLDAISARVASESHMLASPYPDQASPIMLTAWGRQLEVQAWDDPVVETFISDHIGRRSPTAPEPGVTCEGAIGVPPDDPTAFYDESVELMAEGS